MTRRYYLPQLPDQGGIVALPDEEAVHAARVMRVKAGDAVVAFDGYGKEAAGTVSDVQRRQVYLELEPPQAISREPRLRITIGVSLPKGDRAKVLIEKLTELGVAELVPIECQRTQGRAGKLPLDKFQRYVIEASKQCERNQLMQIASVSSFDDFLRGTTKNTALQPIQLLAHPGQLSVGEVLAKNQLAIEAIICVGPEGGFTDDEVRQATEAGFHGVSLGKSILRVETAAAALVSRLVVD